MPTISLNAEPNDGITVLDAVTAASSAPDQDAVAVATNGFRDVRTLISFAGAVTSLTLQLWIWNRKTDTWHTGATSSTYPIDPAGGPCARDWLGIGLDEVVTFTVAAIGGTGSVTVHTTGI